MDEMNVDDIENLRLSQSQYDELGDIVRANNDWNKHIVDLEDLQRLSREYNFRFTEEFAAKARDQKVSIRGVWW